VTTKYYVKANEYTKEALSSISSTFTSAKLLDFIENNKSSLGNIVLWIQNNWQIRNSPGGELIALTTIENSRIEVILQQYEIIRHEVLELKRGGNLPAAIAKARKAVDFLEQQQDGLAYLIDAANNLAALYGEAGDWSSAEPIFEKCRYVREKVCGPKDKDTATALMMLGVAKYSLRKYSDAEALLQASLALREELFGSSHPAVARVLINLAAVYKETGRSIDAKKLWDRAERIGLPESLKKAQTEGNSAAPIRKPWWKFW